jgi:hypothetical protein
MSWYEYEPGAGPLSGSHISRSASPSLTTTVPPLSWGLLAPDNIFDEYHCSRYLYSLHTRFAIRKSCGYPEIESLENNRFYIAAGILSSKHALVCNPRGRHLSYRRGQGSHKMGFIRLCWICWSSRSFFKSFSRLAMKKTGWLDFMLWNFNLWSQTNPFR